MMDSSSEPFGRAEQKKRGMFHRPAKDAASEQLAYAKRLQDEKSLRAARSAYNDLVHHWHHAPEAPQAQLQVARILYEQGKYEKSFKAFQYLIDHFSGRLQYNEILEYQLKIANQVMGDRWGDILFLPGFEAPERALPLLNKLVMNAPNWDKTAAVRLTIGMIHEELKDYESAVSAYEAVEQYPAEEDVSENAAFRKATCLYTLSEKSPRDEKRCRTALSALASFLARHKTSERQAEIEGYLESLQLRLATMYYDRALFYDTISKRPESALIAYRDFLKKFPASDRAQYVFARMDALERQVKESK
jgi:tetratricopeptide (TPR) repeat protein